MFRNLKFFNLYLEVCSAHPTSGGPYFWAAMLSEPRNAAFASWVCGWFNLLGKKKKKRKKKRRAKKINNCPRELNGRADFLSQVR